MNSLRNATKCSRLGKWVVVVLGVLVMVGGAAIASIDGTADAKSATMSSTDTAPIQIDVAALNLVGSGGGGGAAGGGGGGAFGGGGADIKVAAY